MIDLTDGRPAADHGTAIEICGLKFEPYIDRRQLERGVDAVAEALLRRYADALPIVVAVLNGGAIFHADLLRRMPVALEVDYVRVASYHGGRESSGTVSFSAMPGTQPLGRNVIIVEDIVDTGRTAHALRRYFYERSAATVEVASLLYKPDANHADRAPEYSAFSIPNRFVVGYGLDYRGQGRNLPSIYASVEPSSETARVD